MLPAGSYSLIRFSTCDEGVYFMYMTAGTGRKATRIYETKGSFITIQSLACFQANVKIYQQYGTNYITSVIRRHISARSSVVMEPHNSLITSGNLLAD